MEKTAVKLQKNFVMASLLAAGVLAAGCGGSSGGDRNATGGTTGTGGSVGAGGSIGTGGTPGTPGTGGATGTGGVTGTGGTSAPSASLSCTPGISPAAPLLTDFSKDGASGWHATAGKWGTAGATNLSGSIFSYGGAVPSSTLASAVDTVSQNLVLSGNVVAGDYSGGGLSFDSCVNTSVYTGVQFTLGGTVAGCDLYLQVQTFEQQSVDNKGGCPKGGSCYSFPSSPKLATSGPVTVKFADLTGGKPATPAEIVKEMVGLQWQFQSPAPVGDGGQSGCTGINLTISNVTFVSN
jgi:hypothetical protein